MGRRAGTLRVATVGGSTTADGYPAAMQEILVGRLGQDRVEVLNFGTGYWTSAHSLVNLLLTVLDYRPDYVVILHAWNDDKVYGAEPGSFRSDYSHVLKAFDPPRFVPDRYLLRSSVVYRLARLALSLPPHAFLGPAIARRVPGPRPEVDPQVVRTFARNIEWMVDLCRLRGARPVLVTMPRSQDPSRAHAKAGPHIDACNRETRQLATRRRGEVLLLDLAREVEGRYEDEFVDVAHMSPAGWQRKAARVADVLLEDLGRGAHPVQAYPPPASASTTAASS